jgi:hypothetical protein
MRTFGLLISVLIAALIDIRFDGNVSALGWSHVAQLRDGAPSDLLVQIKKKKNKDTSTPGEHSCPPGYVVLDKPNKYGAFCEPKEGLPAPAPEKCKFPGEIGTPPNCTCPNNTEFLGFRGCVKFTFGRKNCEVLPNKPGAYVRQDFWEQQKCFPVYGKGTRGSCLAYHGSTDNLECCCEVKVYEK